MFLGENGSLEKRLVFGDEVGVEVEEDRTVDYEQGSVGVEWRAMISMELPGHATQHGALHLGVGINPGDPAGSALAAIHSHQQDSLGLHHHGHGGGNTGGMHDDEESKKKRTFLLTNLKQTKKYRKKTFIFSYTISNSLIRSLQWIGNGNEFKK